MLKINLRPLLELKKNNDISYYKNFIILFLIGKSKTCKM